MGGTSINNARFDHSPTILYLCRQRPPRYSNFLVIAIIFVNIGDIEPIFSENYINCPSW